MRDEVQFKQEEEYFFPYHYVSKRRHEGFSQNFVDTWGINYVSTIDFMLDEIGKINPNSIVDIGCGDGRFSREVAIQFPRVHVKGIDYSEKAISLARVMNAGIEKLSFENCDITQKNAEEKFDLAILMEVYEHIPLEMTDRFLKGVHDFLKDNGCLILTVPHSNKQIEYKHYQHFTEDSLCQQISKYFDIEIIVPFEKKSILRKIMQVLLSNRIFSINNGKILNFIYDIHMKYLFKCKNENECQRIFLKARAK